jgi:hypothetical protein
MDNQPQDLNQNVDSTLNPTPNTEAFQPQGQDFSYFDPTQNPQTPAQPEQYFDTSSYPTTPEQPGFSEQVQPEYSAANQDFSDPNLPPQNISAVADYSGEVNPNLDPNLQEPLESANTFIEQKTGNKKLFIIAGVVIAVLVLIAGTLVYLNTRNINDVNNPTPLPSEQTPTPNPELDKQEEKVDVSLTGGDNTPATKARTNSKKKIDLDWNLKSFISPVIDENGNCIVLETCGPDSDKDKDGLTTLQEFQFGTDPLNEDTDADKVADGDEVFVFYSDPKTADSDGDTYKDGDELTACYDPILNSNDNISLSRQTTIGNNVSLKQLHEPTISTIKTSGASQGDVNSKGVNSVKCVKPASEDTNTGGTSTPSNSDKSEVQDSEKVQTN